MSMSDFGIKVILASQNKLESISLFLYFGKSLYKIGVISFMSRVIHQ